MPGRKTNPNPSVHNSSTYSNLGCRCEVCRAAVAADRRRRVRENREARLLAEAARRVHVVEGITHGAAGFGYWNCRCETCRTAHVEAARQFRIRQASNTGGAS